MREAETPLQSQTRVSARICRPPGAREADPARASPSVVIERARAGAGVARTAQTLNSGIRLIGSSAGLVRRFADCSPPQ
jgi:hypothetical protein